MSFPVKSRSLLLGLLASFHLYNEDLIKLSAKGKKNEKKKSLECVNISHFTHHFLAKLCVLLVLLRGVSATRQ